MNSYSDYSSSSSSWSYGGTGASIWQTSGSLSNMRTPAAVTVTGPTRGISSSPASASLSSASSLLPDDIQWRTWPNIVRRDEFESRATPAAFSSQPPEPDSSTLCMSNLEPWMDHEYASQVVRLMGWDRNATNNANANTSNNQNAPIIVKIPPPASDSIPQHNNPGYCLITFPTAAHAANVLASLNSTSHKDTSGTPLLMPNSSRPFNLQWANSVQLSQALPLPFPSSTPNPLLNTIPLTSNATLSSSQGQQKEYSIFVGDLAPETSNSDLVAVFRNPVLGLRNDREPKFIRPFYSCKSAKIMLDPVTGVSRGYGFVRFTDEADQQRALIEMHGLYCLSRPMRVSPATAKFKPDGSANATDGGHQQNVNPVSLESAENANVKPSLVRSVSSPVAANVTSPQNLSSNTAARNGNSDRPDTPDKNSAKTPNPDQAQAIQVTPQILAQIKELAAEGPKPPAKEWNLAHIQQMATLGNLGNPSSSYPASFNGLHGNGLLDEAWNHQAQARAILGNLIGPNGEQLTSTDPYNTTVFVGGLSPLISEETLRTFFTPFGDIHYVKVPLGKHCGFVQFVRKADAERAIERMQGFPIGGSRIRLSWGRSQYKAAQAAAQAAQQAQVEHATRLAAALSSGQTQPMLQLTQEQAIQLLYNLGYNPQPVVSNSNDSQSTQFQPFANQSMPTVSNGMESSQTNSVPGQSTLSVSVPRSYSYSQGFSDGLSPSGHYTENVFPGDPSLPQNAATTSRLTNFHPNGAYSSYATEGSSTFQVSDILKNESPSPFTRIPQQSHSQSELSSVIRRTPPRMQHLQQQGLQTHKVERDDTGNGVNYLTELGSSLANLDLGHEMFSRRSLGNGKGNDALMNGTFRERRPLSNSISAPLNLAIGTNKLTSET